MRLADTALVDAAPAWVVAVHLRRGVACVAAADDALAVVVLRGPDRTCRRDDHRDLFCGLASGVRRDAPRSHPGRRADADRARIGNRSDDLRAVVRADRIVRDRIMDTCRGRAPA